MSPSPPREELVAAVEEALRAPSVYNTQPWRWRVGDGTVELHADWTRHLAIADPDRRDLVISCGAALHHLLVALAARGLAADVARLPDPERSGHLATVVVRRGEPDAALAALQPAIARRRTDRRRFSSRPVAEADRAALVERATRDRVLVQPVADTQRLGELLSEAARRQEAVPGYAAELQRWTHRYAGGHDGVAAASVAAPAPATPGPLPMRRLGRSGLAQPPLRPGQGMLTELATALVVATREDGPLDALRAGEAASEVLLAATALGLATTPLSQGLEVESSRRELQSRLLGVPEHPQLVLRLGWPAPGAAELPPTPRRRLASVLLPG